MKYCTNCGNQLVDGADTCIACGASVNGIRDDYIRKCDKPNFGFALLGFIYPIVGLILYLIFKDEYPKRAASAGKGAIWGVLTPFIILSVVFGVLFLIYALLVIGYFAILAIILIICALPVMLSILVILVA